MRRLYYLAASLDATRAVSERLHEEGISAWNFHVLAKNPDGLYTHHIHSALPHHRKDFVRTGEIGAVYGAAAALIGSVSWLWLGLGGWVMHWFDAVLITLSGGLIGGLNGIRIGMKRDNHRLESFQGEIEAGRYLMMVDVRKEDKPRIRELMNMEFSGVEYRGNDSTIVRPFKPNDRVYPQEVSIGSIVDRNVDESPNE